MEEDDDLFVVIIGDEKGDNDNKVSPKEEIKTEYILGSESLPADELRQQIFEYGEVIESSDILLNIKKESGDYIEDYDDYEELKYANDDYNQYEDKDSNTNEDEDSNTNEDGQFLNFLDEGSETNLVIRPNTVEALRDDYPDWGEEELVVAVKTFMQNVKPPPLPKVYYTENENSKYTCVVCKKTTETLAAAGRHYEERHGPRFRNCFACGTSFRSRTNLYKHEKHCSSADADIVLRARALFLARGSRERPYMQRDNDLRNVHQRYSCGMCSADFLTKQQLQAHENLHLGLRPYACRECGAAYTSTAGLKSHMIKHTDIKFICDHCGRAFKKKDNLITHLNTHLPQKRFACAECGKRYASVYPLRLHERREHRHLPPPCACALCHKRFNRMSALKEHMKNKHQMELITRKMFLRALPRLGELPAAPAALVRVDELPDPPPPPAPPAKSAQRPRLPCATCGKTYAYRQDLQYHEQRVHTQPHVRYPCELCHRAYAHITVLKKHVKAAHGMVMMSRKKFLKSLPKLIEMKAEVLERGRAVPLTSLTLNPSADASADADVTIKADAAAEADAVAEADAAAEAEAVADAAADANAGTEVIIDHS